jgi:hypothetical protein
MASLTKLREAAAAGHPQASSLLCYLCSSSLSSPNSSNHVTNSISNNEGTTWGLHAAWITDDKHTRAHCYEACAKIALSPRTGLQIDKKSAIHYYRGTFLSL